MYFSLALSIPPPNQKPIQEEEKSHSAIFCGLEPPQVAIRRARICSDDSRVCRKLNYAASPMRSPESIGQNVSFFDCRVIDTRHLGGGVSATPTLCTTIRKLFCELEKLLFFQTKVRDGAVNLILFFTPGLEKKLSTVQKVWY